VDDPVELTSGKWAYEMTPAVLGTKLVPPSVPRAVLASEIKVAAVEGPEP
jgi:hypothetical protein